MPKVFAWGITPQQVALFFQEATRFPFVREECAIPIMLVNGSKRHVQFELKPGYRWENYRNHVVDDGDKHSYSRKIYRSLPIGSFKWLCRNFKRGKVLFTYDQKTGTYVVSCDQNLLYPEELELLDRCLDDPQWFPL